MIRTSAALATALALVAACDRGQPRESPAKSIPSPPAPAPAALAPAAAASGGACTLAPLPRRRPMPERLVAIGDLHGDLAATRAVLRLAGAIDDADRWIGGKLVLVQTGDILDRGDDEQAILDLFARLTGEARAAGGAVIQLLGNHELMNAAADFRYVTAAAMSDFDDVPGVDGSKFERAPEIARKRLAALTPGGIYARRLAGFDVIAIVGDTVFSHAGVLGDWAGQVDAANLSSRCWLDGQAGGFDEPPAVLTSDDSPVWTRAVGGSSADCAAVRRALRELGASRMVVGHTVQARGINALCDGAVWRIDVGLGKSYGGPIEVLELAGTAPPKVLTGTR
ncbi:MAG: metallophosphoesterase [Kofleriaceae bacterium]